MREPTISHTTSNELLDVASTTATLSAGQPKHCPVAYVLINITPYHHARFAAFAAHASIPPVLVELTERDPFECLEFHATSTPYSRRLLESGRSSHRIVPALSRVLDQIAPAIVCVNGWSLPGSVEALIWCARKRVPAIIFSESTIGDTPRSWWKEAVKKRILSMASAVLVGGSAHADYACNLGVPPSRIFKGYDAVDNAHFEVGADHARQHAAVIRARLGLPIRFFLACCRFEHKKNLLRLLEAYSLYRSEAGRQAWSLVLAGDGSQRGRLEALAGELSVSDTVFFLGTRMYSEMPALYGLASAFVHASTTEQWGLVVNEAAAAGLPLLVSERCGCAPDLVHPGISGFLFDPYEPSTIAAVMTSIASPTFDRRRMGSSARQLARNWSPERFASSLADAIRASSLSHTPRPSVITLGILHALSVRPDRYG